MLILAELKAPAGRRSRSVTKSSADSRLPVGSAGQNGMVVRLMGRYNVAMLI